MMSNGIDVEEYGIVEAKAIPLCSNETCMRKGGKTRQIRMNAFVCEECNCAYDSHGDRIEGIRLI